MSKARSLIFSLAFALLLADQITKWWAVAFLSDRGPINILGSFLRFNYATNPGAAFNIGSNFTIFLTIFAVIVSIGLFIFSFKIADFTWSLAFGILLGGVLGNLSDRLFREPGFLHGHVVDFIQLPKWPIFNIADIAITSSGVLIAVLIYRNIEPFPTFGTRRDEILTQSDGQDSGEVGHEDGGEKS
ncbi:MAG: signal peptidase II [Actinomycetota bacterium]|nr:signal peptidase II [Actinomycetota bacterium]